MPPRVIKYSPASATWQGELGAWGRWLCRPCWATLVQNAHSTQHQHQYAYPSTEAALSPSTCQVNLLAPLAAAGELEDSFPSVRLSMSGYAVYPYLLHVWTHAYLLTLVYLFFSHSLPFVLSSLIASLLASPIHRPIISLSLSTLYCASLCRLLHHTL